MPKSDDVFCRDQKKARTFVALSALSFAVFNNACPKPSPALPPLALDEKLGPDQVRCGPVTKTSELIGGVAAYAQVNRSWRCYNNKIRFIVQDGSRPVGNSSVGGSLLDIDLIRDDETQAGEDTFRELAPAMGLNEIIVDEVKVIDDGRQGQQAVLRVSGRPTPPTMLPGAYFLAQEVIGRVDNDYIIKPNSAVIEIRSTVHNESPNALGPLAVADFWAAGRSTRPHTPRFGFGDIDIFSHVPFLAGAKADTLSFAYVCKDNDVTIPLIDGSITVPICTDNFYVGNSDSYSRYVVVGDGSVDSVARQAWSLRGTELGEVHGQVRLADGSSAAKIWVSALSGGSLNDDGSVVINQARSDAEGNYSLALPPGEYRLLAHILGRERSTERPVAINLNSPQTQDLQLGGQGQIIVDTDFLDPQGLPSGTLPAKLSVANAGDTPMPNEKLGEFVERGLMTYAVSVDGHFKVDLPPGVYDLYVSRGFEFTRYQTQVTLTDGDSLQVQASLRQVLDTQGWVGAEFHQHTLGSVDATVPYPRKVMENAAEGIEFAASTDHDNIVDFTPWIEALGLSPYLSAVPGNEVSYQGIGHFNVYPWVLDPADPYKHVGTRIWWGKTVPELFSDLRKMAGDPIIQINHPRGGIGFFATMGLDPTHAQLFPKDLATIPTFPPTVFQDWSSDFDTIEVNGSLGHASYFTPQGRQALFELARDHAHDVPVLADYFALLGAGMRVAATGVSDSHRENVGVGYPRTFVFVDEDDPQHVDGNLIRDALRHQQAGIGLGCLIELRVNDQLRMGYSQPISAAELGQIRVRLQAPPFVSLNNLEIYVNGQARALHLQDDTVVATGEGGLSLPLSGLGQDEIVRLNAPLRELGDDEDAVIIAIARGGTGLWPSAPSSPFCVSAPLYVDRSSDGWIPWLAEQQTLLQDPTRHLHRHPHPHPHP